MNWTEVEKRFNRALQYSFSKKKFLFSFPVLILSSLVMVFSRSLSIPLSSWMRMSFVFLSIFVVSGILLALGVLLIRVYYHEVKALKISISKILGKSFEVMLGAAYLSLPPILLYLLLWILLGVFYLFAQIPTFGQYVGAVFIFGPFILILGAVLLCILNIAILFYVSPVIGLKLQKKMKLAKSVIQKFRSNVFFHLVALFIGSLPVVVMSYVLYLTVNLTNMEYIFTLAATDPIRSFFISLPICAVMTPFVIFFFNFAAEMHQLALKK